MGYELSLKFQEWTISEALILFPLLYLKYPHFRLKKGEKDAMIIIYRTKTGKLKNWEVPEQTHKVWRKYKRTLYIKEPCRRTKLDDFKKYLKKFTKATHNVVSRPD